ncbi:SDR family oxidoreductase [Sphingomonas sp. ASV193]|uniref:SDR family oxidoreductase n=1 Tax=Sphingomonas sp. ASV193 TaxID=3144405 RepID=UPI0032E8EEFA
MSNLLPRILADRLRSSPRRWLVTGAAGFIGSNLVEALLEAGQEVVGLDNFATGHQRNLEEVEAATGAEGRERFRFVEADIRDRDACRAAVEGVDVVLHQAALGSVPRSMADPLTSHEANVDGFLNMLDAARQAGVGRFVYAASSSTYGDDTSLPKVEEVIGNPLSPYAVTKLVNELYAGVYARSYGFKTIGLRYFNVFGPRQDPDGAYAPVIPAFIKAMLTDSTVTINGDGETSRDFCYVANAVQANVLAALASDAAQDQVYNVAAGGRTSLNQLFALLRDTLQQHQVAYHREPVHADFRLGDVRHTQADIGKAERMLGFSPSHDIEQGIVEAMPWYLTHFASVLRFGR